MYSPSTISKLSGTSSKTKTFPAPPFQLSVLCTIPGEKLAVRSYLQRVCAEAANALDRQDPNTVVDNIDALPGERVLAFTLRIRFIGRK